MEVPGVGAVVACDLDSTAVEATKRHAAMNGVTNKIHPLHADAHLHMLQHPQVVHMGCQVQKCQSLRCTVVL